MREFSAGGDVEAHAAALQRPFVSNGYTVVLIDIIRLADDKPGILRRTGTKLAVSMRYVWGALARKLGG